MAWTYTTLKTAIQGYLQTTDSDFVSTLPTIITQAEDRILKSVQLPDFRKNQTGTITQYNKYLSLPTSFLSPYSLAIDNSGYEFLLFNDCLAFFFAKLERLTSSLVLASYALR